MNNVNLEQPLLGGTDGFRATATEDPGPGQMNPETIAGLTYALIEYQRECGIGGPVVVSQDTRPSGELLRSAAISAAYQADAEVIDVGVLPTPAAQKIAGRVGALATVVITASHNHWTDNGWKGMLGNRKPSTQAARDISDRYWRQVESGLDIPVDFPAGSRMEQTMWQEWYTAEVVADITGKFGEKPLEGCLFVVDGARGAGKAITPEVFRRLGAHVETFGCKADEGLINDGCGAADLSGLKGFLARRPDITGNPDFIGAVANDGDADRVMGVGVGSKGELVEINGNHIMELMAFKPYQPGIVGTIYTNGGLRQRLESHGVDFEECDNGDVYVTNALAARQARGEAWTRGGEFTGHLIDTEWLTSGDGVRMAAWLAAQAARSGKTFGEIHEAQPLWPEVMSKIKLDTAIPKRQREHAIAMSLAQWRLDNPESKATRPIVRGSGTEPVVRVWCEAPSTEIAQDQNTRLKSLTQAALQAADGSVL